MSSKNLAKQNLLFLTFLFGFSFFIRIFAYHIFFQNNKTMTDFDSKVYIEVGINVSEGKGLINKDGSSHFLRVPLYPTFIGICYKLFGQDPKKVLIIQSFISSLIPILIFFLSTLIFPNNVIVAKASSLISCLHIGFVTFSNLLMAESLFTLFFLLFLIMFFTSIKNNSKLYFFIAGMLLGISSLIRPVGSFILMTTFFVIITWQRSNIKTSFKICFNVFLGWCLIVFWWLARNFLLTGHIFFHTLPGIHFYKHLAARVVMNAERISYIESLKKLDLELWVNLKDKNKNSFEIEQCIEAERISKKYCLKYPINTIKNIFINAFKTTFSLYSSEIIFIYNNGILPAYENSRGIIAILMRFLKPNVSSYWILITIYFEILFMLFLWIGNIVFLTLAIFKENLLRNYKFSFRTDRPDTSTALSTKGPYTAHSEQVKRIEGSKRVRSVFPFVWIRRAHHERVKNFNPRIDTELLIKIFPFIFIFIFLSLACGFARLRLPIEPFLIILSVYFWLNFYKKLIRN